MEDYVPKCTVLARITPKTGCLKMKRNFRRTSSCEKDNSIYIYHRKSTRDATTANCAQQRWKLLEDRGKNMTEDIKHCISTCDTCQRVNDQFRKPQAELHPIHDGKLTLCQPACGPIL